MNNDGSVSPIDGLLVINQLNLLSGDVALSAPGPDPQVSGFVDVNGDGSISPIDALLVINALNDLAEAEAAAPPVAAIAAAVDEVLQEDETTGLDSLLHALASDIALAKKKTI